MKTRFLIFLFLSLFLSNTQKMTQASGLPGINLLLLSQHFKMVKDFGTSFGGNEVMLYNPNGVLTTFQGLIFFVADDGTHGAELWCSNGTSSGTYMVSDINPGSEGSMPTSLTVFNNALYFFARDSSNGYELRKTFFNIVSRKWITALVKDINLGIEASVELSTQLIIFKNMLYFSADDGISGRELWRSDGTEAGTERVFDLYPGSPSSSPLYLTIHDNALFFKATATTEVDLWKLTYNLFLQKWLVSPVKDIGPAGGGVGNFTNMPGPFATYNDELYFRAKDALHGEELWKTDGTTSGTLMVKDITLGTGSTYILGEPIVFDNELYFSADNTGTAGMSTATHLWKTNGTAAGTVQVSKLFYGKGGTFMQEIFNNNLYFYTSEYAGDKGSTSKLWRRIWNDAANSYRTILVKDFGVTKDNYLYLQLFTYFGWKKRTAIFDDVLYFSGPDQMHGSELWKIDKQNSASLVKDLNPGTESFGPFAIIEYHSQLYFFGRGAMQGMELLRWNK